MERIFGLHTAPDILTGTVGLKPGLNNALAETAVLEGTTRAVSVPANCSLGEKEEQGSGRMMRFLCRRHAAIFVLSLQVTTRTAGGPDCYGRV